MNVKTCITATGLALASLGFAGPALAEFSHAGGFVCGFLNNTNDRVVGGDHRTLFNIRNGNNRGAIVDLKLALGFPAADPAPNGEQFTPGATTTLQSVTLQPGEAVMIDCAEIFAAVADLDVDPPPYFSGILDVISLQRLQVTRTQTAGANGEDISTLSVVEIEPRLVEIRTLSEGTE